MPAAQRREVLLNKWQFQKELPGATPSLTQTPAESETDFDDHGWETVGVPHSFNDQDTFQNASASDTFQGIAWYRSRFVLDQSTEGKKVFLQFDGVSIGTAVYVNGKFKPGNTTVAQPGQVTHVGDFLPFALDISDDVHVGAENVVAVRVSNLDTRIGYHHQPPGKSPFTNFFTPPGFGSSLDFGMGFGGIACPVSLVITSKVHVPSNAYSPLQKWGTNLGTVSASDETARVRMQTNIENENSTAARVTLKTSIIDAAEKIVVSLKDETRAIQPGEIALFDQTADLNRPQLWYPNNSPYGKPYLYRVQSDVFVDGVQVDSVESPLGIRTITWDDDYCVINGKRHILNGFGQRNIYPALGCAVPAEIQWNDVKLIADCGGNLLRVGHVPATVETVKACDAYGILVLIDSGDNEWSLKGKAAMAYKKEYDRDLIIRFRNHPSIAVWESNNGIAKYSPKSTMDVVDQWDTIQPRIVGSRDSSDYFPADRKIMIGYTNRYKKVPGSPSINWEAYFGNFSKDKTGKQAKSFCIARFDYDNEKAMADHYVADYLDNLKKKACGWIAWMLAETQGEAYLTYLNGKNQQKSLGSCALDGNRFPKITYQIYKNALWIPFSIRPGVTLQSHWNLSGRQDVDAWSNCPKLELFLNGQSKGVIEPDARLRCTWKDVDWQSGILKAVGLNVNGTAVCSETRVTANKPHRVELRVEPALTKPSGETFTIVANGSDAAIVTARIVDADGVWCPLADNNIRFSVSGPGNYRGSYNFYVTPDKPINYHGPGDAELQAEGGMMRVAVRSTFSPGVVQVQATAAGLASGNTSFKVEPISQM